jgi:hypothetical protein
MLLKYCNNLLNILAIGMNALGMRGNIDSTENTLSHYASPCYLQNLWNMLVYQQKY